MCRIAGIVNPSLPVPRIQELVKEMCFILQHGGPDDEGFYTDADHHLVFGHRRLSLIDLSAGGHQPMTYGNGRQWISYNGELYNYIEIRDELKQAGYYFNTASDTEVILAAFAAWGTNAFQRFNGMFAFALWDADTASVFLVRDPSGIKPLYFAASKEGLTFASEVKAFQHIPWLQQKNEKWPVFLLAYGHLPEPVTMLQEVRPLRKGCFLQYKLQTCEWDIQAFSFFSYIERIDDREAAKSMIRDSLQQSVQRHLLSDAPIGVFLSGGLDSSIIATLAARYHTAELKTLSIIFEEEKYSEKKYQDLVLDKLHCPNWQEVLTENEFQLQLPRILQDMDMPGCDGINTWFISKYARQSGLKAVLSGIGGDELFGGYPSFNRIDKVNWIEKMPASILKAGRYSATKKFRRMAFLSLRGAKGFYLFLRGQFIPSSIARHLDASEAEIWKILEEQPLLEDIESLSLFNQASWIEMNMYMQNQLLRDSDVMSMAHGIEIRVPFLDKDFVTLALNLRSGVKSKGDFPKQLLIDSFRDVLPEPVWNRKKMGFSFPFTEWMAKNEMVKDVVAGNGREGVASYDKFLKGSLHWSQLLALLLLRQYQAKN